MAKVENTNAPIPARTESDSSVRSTLVTTLPQTIVDNVKLESLRRSSTLIASRFPLAASTSRRSLLTLKIARLSPEETELTKPKKIQCRYVSQPGKDRINQATAAAVSRHPPSRRIPGSAGHHGWHHPCRGGHPRGDGLYQD